MKQAKRKIQNVVISLLTILTSLPLGGLGWAFTSSAGLGWALTSCSSWIEEDPEGLVTDEKVGDSDDAAASWVTGTYSKLIYDMFCWGYFPRVLEFDADYISGPDWLFGTFGAGNFQGESDVTDALWKGCYGLIARANNAERHINAMTNVSEAVKNNAIGELKFLRGFAYFLLVRAYGPLPIQPEELTTDYNQPRQSVATVYDYIEKNLEEAASLLYKNTDKAWQSGHVSAGSAAGLLAKVYATQAAAAMPAGTEITIRTGRAYDEASLSAARVARFTRAESGASRAYAPLQSITMQKSAVSGYEQMDAKALYQKAADWAKRVIDGQYGSYELLPYDQLWKKANCNASEFMFSLCTVSGDATYKVSVHSQYEGYMTEPGSDFIQEGGWVGCTRHWYDLFDHDDYRITKGVKHRWRAKTQAESNSGFYYPQTNEYAIMATGYDLNGNPAPGGSPTGIYADGVNYYYSQDAQCLAFTTKYMDVTNNAIANADANFPFLRYADVLLIYAEALNELGQSADAITYLNLVRARSNATLAPAFSASAPASPASASASSASASSPASGGLPAALSTPAALDTPAKLRSAIIEERAKELACEADRRWDLIRWGIYLQAMNAIGGSDDAGVLKTRSERNLLFPIPQPELNTNTAITENNPGWN
ncbi:MAG: RagB/SusD family nutrient uptake outer membrane protein [Prevotella sp.]|nr:RagB/SusD family nutrient uptake outer membrane protein [Prevotella sp.]